MTLRKASDKWQDSLINDGYVAADSDDAVLGTQTYQWVNGSQSDFLYNGRRVRITYISFLADSRLNGGRPDTFSRYIGFGATAENDPTFTTNFVPEPAFYQFGTLLALGGIGMLRLRRRA
jgi:hypothetical protein